MSNMSQIDIRKLDTTTLAVFVTLLDERSVSRTAERLGLTQSAVSHALARLRSLWGDPLFVRGDGGMVPTSRAVALAPGILEAVRRLEALLEENAGFDPTTDERRFVLGMSDYAAALYLPRVMPHVVGPAGRISLLVRHASRATGFDMLREGGAELLVGNFPEAPADLRQAWLAEQDFVCAVAAARAPPGSGGGWSIADYLAAEHLHVSLSGDMAGLVDAALARRGVSRRVRVTVPHFWLIGHLLAQTSLVATEPRAILEPLAKLHGLTLFAPPFEVDSFAFSVVWHRRSDADAAHAWLRAITGVPS